MSDYQKHHKSIEGIGAVSRRERQMSINDHREIGRCAPVRCDPRAQGRCVEGDGCVERQGGRIDLASSEKVRAVFRSKEFESIREEQSKSSSSDVKEYSVEFGEAISSGSQSLQKKYDEEHHDKVDEEPDDVDCVRTCWVVNSWIIQVEPSRFVSKEIFVSNESNDEYKDGVAH